MRSRIVKALASQPSNMNQLASRLKIDYKTVQYQIEVLSKHKLVETPESDAYGAVYFLTELMEYFLDYVNEIWKKGGKT